MRGLQHHPACLLVARQGDHLLIIAFHDYPGGQPLSPLGEDWAMTSMNNNF